MTLLDFLKPALEPLFVQKDTGGDLLTDYAKQKLQQQTPNVPASGVITPRAPSAMAFFPKQLQKTAGSITGVPDKPPELGTKQFYDYLAMSAAPLPMLRMTKAAKQTIKKGVEALDPTVTAIADDLHRGAIGNEKARELVKKIPSMKKFFEPKPIPVFKGFQDLSTKLLEKLKGRSTVSKQFISDLTNSPDLKQPERDLIRNVLKDHGDTVSVPDFANRVKSELLPLEASPYNYGKPYKASSQPGRYENIALPDELRGPIANYNERIYESPIKTSGGSVHFSGAGYPNYFAHTRIEDLPDQKFFSSKTGKEISPKSREAYGLGSTAKEVGGTRRVIELQSDLFQKGRLESEFMPSKTPGETFAKALPEKEGTEFKKLSSINWQERTPQQNARIEELQQKAYNLYSPGRNQELSKLEPYRNTWHERIIREEVKQAAKDGKTKLQFPTGETAMKIEGLGEESGWQINERQTRGVRAVDLRPDNMKVGSTIFRYGQMGHGGLQDDSQWIITDVLGDGKFKAVPKEIWQEASPATRQKTYGSLSERAINQTTKEIAERAKESFDISGKVDTNNPIYRFYEKEVGKYLTNKYGAKMITDPQGVKWWEVSVKPEMKKMPIEALGMLPFTLMPPLFTQKDND